MVVTDINETDRGEEASLCSEALFQRHDVRRLEDWREIVVDSDCYRISFHV